MHIEAAEMLAGALGVEDVVEDNKGGATGVFSCTKADLSNGAELPEEVPQLRALHAEGQIAHKQHSVHFRRQSLCPLPRCHGTPPAGTRAVPSACLRLSVPPGASVRSRRRRWRRLRRWRANRGGVARPLRQRAQHGELRASSREGTSALAVRAGGSARPWALSQRSPCVGRRCPRCCNRSSPLAFPLAPLPFLRRRPQPRR